MYGLPRQHLASLDELIVIYIDAATLHDRVRNRVFVLDELTRWNNGDEVFGGRLDLRKVATLGGCCGFEAAAEFCRNAPRCQATILVLCDVDHWGCVESVPDLDQFGVRDARQAGATSRSMILTTLITLDSLARLPIISDGSSANPHAHRRP